MPCSTIYTGLGLTSVTTGSFCERWPPIGPMQSISKAVRLGLERAGITEAPSQGAYLLRHSAATGILRAGGTLDTVGAVLRHRSIDTTMHYAKVDIGMLRSITQPWPGDVSC